MNSKKLEKLKRQAHGQERHRWFFHAAHHSLETSHISTIKEYGKKFKIISQGDDTYMTERKFNSSYYDAFGEESPFYLLDKNFIEIRWLSKGLPESFGPFIVLGKLNEYHVDFGKEYCWALSNKSLKWCQINIDYVKANTNKPSGSDCYSFIHLWYKI